ncbi:1321_t:CDS:2 [Funneliformis geosporum]|uniref:1321_t:CDS:1 n=1 Tax=Funneliformis geosporum TaxID=1117311 RepID=A0A9W4WT52_9GLOM|nr:1321_t:CDS:2 [Funneliformis geosporum]
MGLLNLENHKLQSSKKNAIESLKILYTEKIRDAKSTEEVRDIKCLLDSEQMVDNFISCVKIYIDLGAVELLENKIKDVNNNWGTQTSLNKFHQLLNGFRYKIGSHSTIGMNRFHLTARKLIETELRRVSQKVQTHTENDENLTKNPSNKTEIEKAISELEQQIHNSEKGGEENVNTAVLTELREEIRTLKDQLKIITKALVSLQEYFKQNPSALDALKQYFLKHKIKSIRLEGNKAQKYLITNNRNALMREEIVSSSNMPQLDLPSNKLLYIVGGGLLAKKKFELFGKTAMDEFACGGTGLLANTGIITNPYNSQHITGGSSSGSAVAIVKKLVPFALGSDTGDSVRQPAAYCGVIGFKPSQGLISRFGLIPMASSLDTVGILTDSITTTKEVFLIISQPDPQDLLTIASQKNKIKLVPFSSTKKIAILKGIEKYLSAEFAKLYHKVINLLKAKKYQFETIQIPPEISENLQLAYLIICSSELVSHLNACQGIAFGKKEDDAGDIKQKVQQVRNNYLGKSVHQRLMLGSYFLQNKKDYVYTHFFRQKVQKWVEKNFSKYDFLLFPSPNSEAPKIEHTNFAGIPSLSLPIGFVNELPVSININGSFGKDKEVLALAQLLEKEITNS